MNAPVTVGNGQAARILEAMAAGACAVDPAWRITHLNAEAERLLRRRREELLGRDLWSVLSAPGPPPGLLDGGTTTCRCPALPGWLELTAVPAPGGHDLTLVDVTARQGALEEALERAERADAQLRLLARVSDALATPGGVERAATGLARLLVPELADWSVVSVLAEDGGRRDLGWAHRAPEQEPDVAAFAAAAAATATEGSPVGRALRSGRPLVVPAVSDDALGSLVPDAPTARLARRLAPSGLVVVPVTADAQLVGALVLVNGEDRGPHTGAEVAAAAEVGHRLGQALERARVATQQRRLSEALQRSLLTDPPKTDRLQVAVRYAPAARQAQVGGDWYDAFVQPSGATMLVIGDVMGHDTAAAAAMGELRGLLRGIAHASGRGPASVLSGLDRAMAGLRVDTLATALVARLEPLDAARARLRWSSAGHPLPLVVRGTGVVEVLDAAPDLLLGLAPDAQRRDHTAVLQADDTLLLHTDGLVERRGAGVRDDAEALRSALAGLGPLPLEDLCGRLLDRMLTEDAEDDVALVAVRLRASPSSPALAPPLSPAAAAAPLALRLPPEPSAVSAARHFVTARLREAGLEDLADDAELAVSELAGNAVLHARTDMTVTVGPLAADAPGAEREDPGGAVHGARVAVADRSPVLPVPAPLGASAMSGRGLPLVDALSRRWGSEPAGRGKVVWFEVARGAAGAEVEELSAEALLDLWGDAEDLLAAVGPARDVQVVLADMPVQALVAAKGRVEDLVRDLRFVLLADRDASDGDPDVLALAQRLDGAAQDFSAGRLQLRTQVLAAAARGLERATLELRLDPSLAAAAERYRTALDEADDASRRGRLLLAEGLAEHAALRRGYLDEIVRQLRAAGS